MMIQVDGELRTTPFSQEKRRTNQETMQGEMVDISIQSMNGQIRPHRQCSHQKELSAATFPSTP
jgi:hypothetical protein